MLYMISSRSVTDGVSLSVSKSKLVYSSLIFVDNNLTSICLLTQQQLVTVSVFLSVIHKIFYLYGEFCIFKDKVWGEWSLWQQSTILPVTAPNFHRLKNTSKLSDLICNEVCDPPQLKCLGLLHCDLSLITKLTLDCRHFSDIHISQGSVATHLRFVGMFKYEFVANLPSSLSAKEFWKSVNIWGSYGQERVSCFFDSLCRYKNYTIHNVCMSRVENMPPRSATVFDHVAYLSLVHTSWTELN